MPVSQEVGRVEPGKVIEREIKGGETHQGAGASGGECLLLKVEPGGINVMVALFAPDGKPLVAADYHRPESPEDLAYVAEKSGSYLVGVRPVETAALGRSYLWPTPPAPISKKRRKISARL